MKFHLARFLGLSLVILAGSRPAAVAPSGTVPHGATRVASAGFQAPPPASPGLEIASHLLSGIDPARRPFDATRREEVLSAFTRLPFAFVENAGQFDPRVRYCAQGPRYAFFATSGEVVLSFAKGAGLSPQGSGSPQGASLALRFLGADPRVTVEGEERAPGEVNFFRGNDPARWRTRLPRYAEVAYRDLWPGVDLMLRGRGGELEYVFRLRPGARLEDVRLAWAGAERVRLDGRGALLIETSLGTLRDSAPIAYQEIAGARVPVESRYALGPGAEFGFAVGAGWEPGS